MGEVILISTTEICKYHEIERTFITAVEQAGLIEFKLVGGDTFIPDTELSKLERIIRLHHELEINIEGIEAISHLLERIELMQEEVRQLKNKLR